MTDAKNANTGNAAKGSGCGCSARAATETAKTGCCGGGHDHAGHDHTHHDHTHHDHAHDGHHATGGATMRDPVCGMSVDPATAKHRLDYQGRGAMAFRLDQIGTLMAFAGHDCSSLTVDGRQFEFADRAVGQVGWAPVFLPLS